MTFQLTADQHVVLTLTFVDKWGNPVTAPAGVPTWAVDNAALATLTAPADGLSADLDPVGPVGPVTVSASLDGVTGSLVVDVAPGAVAAISIAPGTPVAKA